MNFCLFGVYKQSDQGQVVVENPNNCKTNCPACAKMCPQQAIIFPKYEHSPINGDEVVSEKDQHDLTKIDIYKMIQDRQKNKGALLSQMAQKLDIPSDIIDSVNPLGTERAD
jgi:ferredoxin